MRSFILLLIVLSAARAAAQAPSTPPAGREPAPAQSYSYDAGGRRDPFLNLTSAGTEPKLTGKRGGDGAAALTVNEISLRGILQSRGALVALVHGTDNKTYLVHQGDKFADGVLKTITPQALVIVQEVNDPLSLVKQREVRKQLRAAEESKP